MTKLELIKAQAFELDPNKRYILVFNNREITKENFIQATELLKNLDITFVNFIVSGSNAIKVIEL